jgi:hypothetical protein
MIKRILTAPDFPSRSMADGLKPKSASTASVCWPTDGPAAPRAAGVLENLGAGAGCSSPLTSVKTARAARCGSDSTSSGARTGVTQASVPAKTSAHSSRGRLAIAAAASARCLGQSARLFCASAGSSDASPSPRVNAA